MTPNIPENTIIIPKDNPDKYMSVRLTKDSVVLQLYKMSNNHPKLDIALDKKILPHLIDALIDLHNSKKFDFPEETD